MIIERKERPEPWSRREPVADEPVAGPADHWFVELGYGTPALGDPIPLTGREADGAVSLRARATDAAGNVQPAVPPWNRLGYGNNAVEVSYVDVR